MPGGHEVQRSKAEGRKKCEVRGPKLAPTGAGLFRELRASDFLRLSTFRSPLTSVTLEPPCRPRPFWLPFPFDGLVACTR